MCSMYLYIHVENIRSRFALTVFPFILQTVDIRYEEYTWNYGEKKSVKSIKLVLI